MQPFPLSAVAFDGGVIGKAGHRMTPFFVTDTSPKGESVEQLPKIGLRFLYLSPIDVLFKSSVGPIKGGLFLYICRF